MGQHYVTQSVIPLSGIVIAAFHSFSAFDSFRQWDDQLGEIVLTYNKTYHASVGMAPAELILG